jgi:hypothetical protein
MRPIMPHQGNALVVATRIRLFEGTGATSEAVDLLLKVQLLGLFVRICAFARQLSVYALRVPHTLGQFSFMPFASRFGLSRRAGQCL